MIKLLSFVERILVRFHVSPSHQTYVGWVLETMDVIEELVRLKEGSSC